MSHDYKGECYEIDCKTMTFGTYCHGHRNCRYENCALERNFGQRYCSHHQNAGKEIRVKAERIGNELRLTDHRSGIVFVVDISVLS